MTQKQAKKLKDRDWVWAYKIGTHGECFDDEEFTPIRCYVLGKQDVSYGVLKLGRITTVVPCLCPLSQVFLTKEEAQRAMLKDLDEAITCYENENKALMAGIEDDLRYNQKQLTRLSGLKAVLERSMQ